MDKTSVFLDLPLPVMLAFIALLAGLAVLARQLQTLRRPVVVRRVAPGLRERQMRPD